MRLPNLLSGSLVAAVLIATSSLSAQVTIKIAPIEGSMVRFTATNNTNREVSFLRYNTPLDGFEANLFRVERNGKPLPYMGKLVLRLGPTEQDYVTLGANESVESVVDLSEAYDLSQGGSFGVQFRFPVGMTSGRRPIISSKSDFMARRDQVEDEEDLDNQEVESNPVNILVEEMSGGRAAFVGKAPAKDNIMMAFAGCTSTQQSSINSANSAGRSLAAGAYNQLNSTSGPSNTKYKTWFGTYSSTRYSTVKSNYSRIYSAFGRTWDYTCTTCSSGVIAYVYPNNPYKVWICAYFHQFGSTEKGSFLLHEASHWDVVANTDDFGYGTTFCKNLAISNPTNATRNADNYRYFSKY